MRWTRFWQSWLQENIFQSFDRSYRSRAGRNCLRQRALYITTLSSCEARLEAGSQSCQTQMNLLQLWTRWGNNINSNASFSISTIGLIDVQKILYATAETSMLGFEFERHQAVILWSCLSPTWLSRRNLRAAIENWNWRHSAKQLSTGEQAAAEN